MKKNTILLLSALALASCVDPVSSSNNRGASDDLPAAWPRCPSLEQKWGKAQGPSLQLNGRQAMCYYAPGSYRNAVRIVYDGKSKPREIRTSEGVLASDGKINIMGQSVDFYGSGNETAEIATQAISLTSPQGDTGWFTFEFTSPQHLKGKNIPAFSW